MRYSAGQDLQDQSVSIVYLHIFIHIDKGDENVDVAVHLLGHPLCVLGQGTKPMTSYCEELKPINTGI